MQSTDSMQSISNTNVSSYRTRNKNFTFHMETQKTEKSKQS